MSSNFWMVVYIRCSVRSKGVKSEVETNIDVLVQ